MTIGIFTDSYHPSVNGVVAVADILRSNLEALGHEVFVFAPGSGLQVDKSDPHLIYFPAIKGVFYEEANAALMFPPATLRVIRDCKLDVIHFLTTGPVGLMAVYASHELKKPLVAEYCTDIFEYISHYPAAIAGMLALAILLPFTIKSSRSDLLEIIKVSRPRFGLTKWNKALVKDLTTILHAHCDAVVVHSRHSIEQLKGWQNQDYTYPMALIPTGVDPLPVATKAELQAFAKTYSLASKDEVVLYIGRISAEKNLDLLVEMMPHLLKQRPNAKLVFVGDFDYRPTLEAKARASAASERIVFTGKMPRQKLGAALGNAKVFVFPSLTDTQGLVIHEAALAGLPLVLIDRKVSEVVKNKQDGLYAKNDPRDFASKVMTILSDPVLQQSMSMASKTIAQQFSEQVQTQKVVKIYARLLKKVTAT